MKEMSLCVSEIGLEANVRTGHTRLRTHSQGDTEIHTVQRLLVRHTTHCRSHFDSPPLLLLTLALYTVKATE